ncbi:PilN domain-containing protein [Halanaerobacter jeridensis]|uniref:Type IV pilus assembly protein PilN n=1 Tax=Halanaerobacter jeridensis TaxID=706427 RepID=A0A938XS15_9FIRM|nr:PilN domain-containing protein [Halanaerobacter jeridensis]MBM7555206.1 hypothetical protein [Halanaerobacter jeridensis]
MINLLPDEIKKKRKREKYKKIALVIIVLLLVVLMGTSSYIENLAANYQTKLEKLDEQLQQLEVTKKVISTQLKEKNKVQEQLTLVNNLKKDLNYNWLIQDLQLIIPEKVWLEQLTITIDNKLLIGGKTVNNQQLLETAKRLEKYPYFEGVKIASSQEVKGNLHFEIQGQVSQGL